MSNLVSAGHADAAAIMPTLPTYSKSAVVAAKNMSGMALNQKGLEAQLRALAEDLNDPFIMHNAATRAVRQAAEARVADLTEAGALPQIAKAQEQVESARQTAAAAQAAFVKAERSVTGTKAALMAAQAKCCRNPADTAALIAVLDAIRSVDNANQASAKAKLTYQSNQNALKEAQSKLDDVQRKVFAGVQAQVKQEIAERRLKRDGKEVVRRSIMSTSPNVSIIGNNAGNKAAPLAPMDGRDIIKEGTQGDARYGAWLVENPNGSVNAAGIDLLLKKSTCSFDDLYRHLNSINSDYANDYAETGKWPTDVQIPKGPYVLNADGSINWDEVPKGGYVLDENGDAMKEIFTPDLNEIIDRYGPPAGRYTSPIINEPFSYDQRSLPYVEDLNVYHRYKVTGEFGSIKRYFELSSNEDLKREISMYMKKFKLSFDDLVVCRGRISNGFGAVGGGIQYELPLPVYMLEGLRLISEI